MPVNGSRKRGESSFRRRSDPRPGLLGKQSGATRLSAAYQAGELDNSLLGGDLNRERQSCRASTLLHESFRTMGAPPSNRTKSELTPTGDRLLDEITGAIVERFRPRRIMLFGSRARGDALPDSDYDLFIEMDTDLALLQRSTAVQRLFPRRRWAMDVIVFTPGEVRRWRNDIGSVVYSVEREGRTLYEHA